MHQSRRLLLRAGTVLALPLSLLPAPSALAQPAPAPFVPPPAAAPAPQPPAPPLVAPVAPLAPPVSASAAAALPSEADPQAVVGWLTGLRGTVSLHVPGESTWRAAVPNLPVSDGNSLWTEPGAQAEVQVSASTVVLAPSTELDVSTLDPRATAMMEDQGEILLTLRSLLPGGSWTVATPRGSVLMRGDGRYAIAAGDTAHPTVVTVLSGSAEVTGPSLSVAVAAGQAVTLTGDGTITASLGPAVPDAFVQSVLAAEAGLRSAPLPAPVLRMTGCEALAHTGTWSSVPQYGQVWFPPVAATWVPYREGHWAWVAPWGWTWVDDAPWGFAPFHYGRWAEFGGRWGWVPEAPGVPVAVEPVYAPALVTFATFAAGAAIGFTAAELARAPYEGPGGGPGVVGWSPLGPRQPYLPAFRASPRYVQQVNVVSVNNTTIVQNAIARGPGAVAFAGRGATLVPAGAMALSRPVAAFARPLPGGPVASGLRPMAGALPLAPVAATAGMTEASARSLGVAMPAAGLTALHPTAPGPALTAHSGPGGRPTLVQAPGGPGRVEERAPAALGTPTPSASSAGRQEPGPRPEEAGRQVQAPSAPPLPALRSPGEPPRQTGGAPGPRLDPGGAPGPRSEPAGAVGRPGTPPPAPTRGPEQHPPGQPEAVRPEAHTQPEAAHPEPRAAQAPRPATPGPAAPAAPRPGAPAHTPAVPRPQPAFRPAPPAAGPRPPSAQPERRVEAQQPFHPAPPRPEPPRPARPEPSHVQAPRPEPSRPPPPRPEPSRPQPSRPEPHPQAPHPQPQHPSGPEHEHR